MHSIFPKLRVIYAIYEYDPLLDSSNMTMDDWIVIAKDIKRSYEHFDGFVVLHGTDTLAYTASALSFMLEHLGKPVIVTGSQESTLLTLLLYFMIKDWITFLFFILSYSIFSHTVP